MSSIIKRPVITEKAMKLSEQNQYVFEVDPKSNKIEIKKAIEKAKKGEKVTWKATDSDLYFQFMDEQLFGTFTLMIKAGETEELVIGSKAKSGINSYAVFHLNEKEFAEGNSPPQIIVE